MYQCFLIASESKLCQRSQNRAVVTQTAELEKPSCTSSASCWRESVNWSQNVLVDEILDSRPSQSLITSCCFTLSIAFSLFVSCSLVSRWRTSRSDFSSLECCRLIELIRFWLSDLKPCPPAGWNPYRNLEIRFHARLFLDHLFCRSIV